MVISAIAVFLPTFWLLIGVADTVAEYVVLVVSVVVCAMATFTFAKHLWATPTNIPEHLKAVGYVESPESKAEEESVEQLVDRYSTRWGGDRSRVPDSKKG